MNGGETKDPEKALAHIAGVIERVVGRLQTPHRQKTRLVGQILAAGSGLFGERVAAYCRQLDYLLLEKMAFSREGYTIGAAGFFEQHLGGLSSWLEPLVNSVLRNPQAGAGPGLYSINHEDPKELTHQAKILYHLCSAQPRAPHLLCLLPQGSGRTTSAFLAGLHTLTTRMGSILYISPTPRAARLIARRVDAFLAETGWGNAITSALFIEKSEEDELIGKLQHIVWNDPQQELKICGERQEVLNIVVTVPEYLEKLILQQHRFYKEYLADLQLVVLDSADSYYGTYGSHVSLILRRLRRLLERYAAKYRTFTTIAPYGNAPNHVRRLFGFDDDRFEVVRDIAQVAAAEDAAPWPERMAATWTPPLRFRELGGMGHDAAIPVVALTTRPHRMSSRDGLTGLLGALAHALSRESRNGNGATHDQGQKTKILVLAREDNLTEDDLRTWTASGYRAEVVHSMNELDAEHLENRAFVVFGHTGGWPSFVHQIAHFGGEESLMILAAGSDALSRYLVRRTESDIEAFRAGGQAFFDALLLTPKKPGSEGRPADERVSFSPEMLEIAPDNPEILKLHLYLAASVEGGLTESEALRFFGSGAIRVLESIKSEFPGYRKKEIGSGGDPTHHYYIDADPNSRPLWNPLCVKWDRPGHQENLVPMVVTLQGRARPIGFLERPLLPSLVTPNPNRDQFGAFVRARRRLLVTSADPNSVEVEYGQNLEYRPRLSRIEVEASGGEDITIIIRNREPRNINDPRLDLKMTLNLSRVHIRERLVGRIQADGYVTDDQNVVQFGPGQPVSEFTTNGLLVRFDDLKEDDFELIHSLAHLMKIVLPFYLRFDPEELEIRVFPRTMDERKKSSTPWDLVIYDNHPDGDCFTRALAKYPAAWWKALFETAYEILRGCPCLEGCWQCLKIFECRESHPGQAGETDQSTAANNLAINKKRAFDFLGSRFDSDYRAFWALKSGNPPDGDSYAEFERVFATAQIRKLEDKVIRVLRDKCTFEISYDDTRKAYFSFDPRISTPGVYLSGPNRVLLWPPSNKLKEQDYVFLLAHEFTHNWQFKMGRFNSRLYHYNFENVADPDNIPFRGRLFIEGCARWAEVQVCDHFGLDAHMIAIRNQYSSTEYELGYKLFLFLEYHCDFARLVDFLETAEIMVKLPADNGWKLVQTAADYVRYLYDDGRLAILQSMLSLAGPDAKCLRGAPAYQAPAGPEDMTRKLSQATYLAVPRRSDCRTHADDKVNIDVDSFIKATAKKLKLAFNPDVPVSTVLDRLSVDAKKDIAFMCARCPRRGAQDPTAKPAEGEAAAEAQDEATEPSAVCSVFDACHLHSSGGEGRSTTELLMKISEALREAMKKTADNGEGNA